MRFLILLALIGPAAPAGIERSIPLSATLDPDQVVGGTFSFAMGTGTFVLDPIANTLAFDVRYNGAITGGFETEAHFHGPAPAGQNAPILFNLPLGTTKVGVWNYPQSVERALLRGLVYVDIHSLELVQGECRGQILPDVKPPS